MFANEQNIDWLYALKKRMLFSILVVLMLSIVATMVFIALELRSTLLGDSKEKTRELGVAIDSTLHQLMLLRSPGAIQVTLETLVEENPSVTHVMILDREGKVAYSSSRDEIGRLLDRSTDPSCQICHAGGDAGDGKGGAVVLDGAGDTQRNVSLIINEKDCHECHDPDKRVNGKLIIDRSLQGTDALITRIQIILLGSGLVCLVILVPLFSRLLARGIDKYILEIFSRNEELRLLYVMVERLSKTLDMSLLKEIVIEIFRDILAANEMVLVLARSPHEYSASAWTRESGKIERRKIGEDDPLHRTLQEWMDGRLDATKVSEDAREICMPIEKGGHRLALVIARRGGSQFERARLGLMSVISGHIAVAFDNARLYYIAITDELTRTFTKRHFRTCIDNAFADYQKYGNKIALLMMDLDKFKQVNDTYGHVVGDVVLRDLGEIIRQSVRADDLVFRYGGEEFTVLLPATDVEGAQFVAERIRSATEAHVFEPGVHDLKLTISIGVATCPEVPSVHDLIVDADKALYAAKHQGRNRVVVSDKIYPDQPAPWAP